MDEIRNGKQLLAEGKKAYRQKRFDQAASLFSQASRSFQAGGDALAAAEAANNQSVALLQAGSAQAALQAAEGTDVVFASVGDASREGMALANQAAALEACGRLEEALERYTRANQQLKASGENEMRAAVLKNIATLQLRTGKQLQALASMDAALDNQKRLSMRERFLHKLLRVPLDMLKRK